LRREYQRSKTGKHAAVRVTARGGIPPLRGGRVYFTVVAILFGFPALVTAA
jgi:hypothetical protein